MIELGQLRYFVSVATELNFRRAAERLNMTQPPLTRQIQLLEHQLGVQLLDRSKRSVQLTAAGRAFYIEAQSLLERAHSATLAVQKIAQGDIGAVTIGHVPSAAYAALPQVVTDIYAQHPDIHISLREMPSFEQLQALRTRQLDLGIVRSPMGQKEFKIRSLLREPFVLAIPASHPLANLSELTLQMLHQQPFISYSFSGWRPFYEMFAGMFRAAQVEPRYVHTVGSTLTMLTLVNAGLGIALVPQSASCVRLEQILFRPIALDAGICSELHLIWREDNDNPVLPLIL
ncbi:MAG: LysR family transcriptional regulator, partial [Phycisphaerales bacterium]|nr:LysR family transcriptional regulator [Phycisphaerales bacterium]